MSLIERCNIEGLSFSSRSRDALKIIDHKVNLANYLAGFMVVSPLIEIFKTNGGSVAQVVEDVHGYHWDEFSDALGSINPVLRRQVYMIAAQEELFTSGKERDFWKCVSAAAR